MKDIKQRIAKIAAIDNGLTLSEVTEKLIEEVIKPIAKEAFEAGLDGNVRSKDRESFINEWINENLK